MQTSEAKKQTGPGLLQDRGASMFEQNTDDAGVEVVYTDTNPNQIAIVSLIDLFPIRFFTSGEPI